MKVVKELNVPASFFYTKIIDSVIFDIRKQTGKKLTPQQLNAFQYEKKFDQRNTATIKIEEIVTDKKYSFSTVTSNNNFTVTYEIESLADKKCRVTYEEEVESIGFFQKLNDAVLGFILGFFKKRQFVKMLEMIESSY